MNRAALAALTGDLLLAGCATSRPPEPEPTVVAEPPNARAKLYADCVGSAAMARTYQRYGRYIWYTCRGTVAQALFDAAETYARTRGWEKARPAGPAVWVVRYLSSRENDDRCSLQGAAEPAIQQDDQPAYECVLTQPVGTFLDPAQDAIAPAVKKR